VSCSKLVYFRQVWSRQIYFRQPFCRLEASKNSSFPDCARQWNDLHTNITSSPSLAGFKALLRNSLIESRSSNYYRWSVYSRVCHGRSGRLIRPSSTWALAPCTLICFLITLLIIRFVPFVAMVLKPKFIISLWVQNTPNLVLVLCRT